MNNKKYACAIRCACGHVDVFHLQAKTPEKVSELMRFYKKSVCSECLKKNPQVRADLKITKTIKGEKTKCLILLTLRNLKQKTVAT